MTERDKQCNEAIVKRREAALGVGEEAANPRITRWMEMLADIASHIGEGDFDKAEQQAGVLHHELVGASLKQSHPEWFGQKAPVIVSAGVRDYPE